MKYTLDELAINRRCCLEMCSYNQFLHNNLRLSEPEPECRVSQMKETGSQDQDSVLFEVLAMRLIFLSLLVCQIQTLTGGSTNLLEFSPTTWAVAQLLKVKTSRIQEISPVPPQVPSCQTS